MPQEQSRTRQENDQLLSSWATLSKSFTSLSITRRVRLIMVMLLTLSEAFLDQALF